MRELRLKIREDHRRAQTVQRGAYTMVRTQWGANWGIGFSKWNPNDKGKKGQEYSAEKGIMFATNKAIDDVVRQIVHEQHKAAVVLPPEAIPFTPQQFALREIRDRA